MKRTSVKKVRFTDRTALPDTDKRVLISEECRMRMGAVVADAAGRKRKEATDNKVRVNIIKKVTEKYGAYYQNI